MKVKKINSAAIINMRLLPGLVGMLLSILLNMLLAVMPAQASDERLLTALQGTPQPGALMIGKTRPGVQVKLDDKPLRVTAAGDFVFGFGRDATGERQLTLSASGRTEQHVLALAPRNWSLQRVDGVPERTVAPPSEETLKRIRAETALIKQARATDSSRTDFLAEFIAPAQGPVTGVYGSQRIYNGVPKRPHYGLDFAGPVGAPVVAPADGVVTLVHPDMFYSGGTLIVDHGYGVSSTFIHLHKVLVQPGEEVTQGQLIAEIGAGGRSTGPHLDWRVNWYDERLDPALLIELP